MRREIKFRAWVEEHKEMLHKEMLHFDLTDLDSGIILVGDMCHSVSDCPTMQFTGLHDKHGNEIYEGDVVRYGTVQHEIAFRDGAFQFANVTRDTMALGLKAERIEVIGNIYENPDLLTQ